MAETDKQHSTLIPKSELALKIEECYREIVRLEDELTMVRDNLAAYENELFNF